MNTQTAIAPAPMSTTGARLSGRLILLLSLTVVLPAAPYLFGLEGYIVNIVMQAVTYGIAVVGMTIVLGYTGQINLAQGVFFGLGAYVVALGTMDYGLGFWPMLLLGIAIAALAGIVIGLTTLRLSGHYLAMITISCQQIFDLVLVNWVPVTHGPDGISGIARPSIFGFQLTDDKAYLGLCITVLYLAILLVWWLPETRLGRAMQAVRENQLAAEVTGVKTLAVKVTAFTMCAGLAGIGGALYAAGFSYISPDNFNFKMSIELLTMALLGGAQSPIGSTIGTVLLIMLPEWLRFLKEIYMAGYGLAVILIMVFMPEGIWGIIKSAGGRLHRVRLNAAKYTSMLAPLTLDLPRFDPTPMLELDGLQKHFGGVKAVDGVSIRVARGQIHALIGPNGSGKTTTLNVLNGIYRPTGGRILVDGVDITNKAPNERAAHGVGRTFQNIRLFPSMTVLENVMIGAQRRNNPIPAGEAALRDRALSALSFVDMLDKADAIVKNLPYGHQRLVEIARALAGHPKLLLLDEPAAGLNQTEKGNLVGLLKRLRTQGITIFLIEHDMHLIEQVSDTISVLNFGRKIAEGTPQEVLRHPDVIAAYLGKDAHAAAA
jgi:branched-chain amino acid transport system permease protein